MSIADNSISFAYDLNRIVKCKKCGASNTIDFGEFVVDSSSSEQNMGIRITYRYDTTGFHCSKCDYPISFKGYFTEYPQNTLEMDPLQGIE